MGLDASAVPKYTFTDKQIKAINERESRLRDEIDNHPTRFKFRCALEPGYLEHIFLTARDWNKLYGNSQSIVRSNELLAMGVVGEIVKFGAYAGLAALGYHLLK